MPRTLPWLKSMGSGEQSRERDTKARILRKAKEETPSKTVASSSKRDFFRSSPSPPSSPIHRCPSEEFLVEGFENDDIYMMVEDEFYAVAQIYTQHLHYAEYVRRKREAKEQNAATIEDLARPTNGVTPLSTSIKKRQEGQALAVKQKAGLERIQGQHDEDAAEDPDENDSWVGTSLYDLMLSPRRARSLVDMEGVKSSTRAAAGYLQASGAREEGPGDGEAGAETQADKDLLGETASDDDDDLDAPTRSRQPTQPPSVQRRKDRMSLENKRSNSSSSPLTAHLTEHRAKRPLSMNSAYDTHSMKPERRIKFDDFDELPALRKSSHQQSQRLASSMKTPQKDLNGKNTGAKKARLSEVPTFLF